METKTLSAQQIYNCIKEEKHDFQLVDLRREDFAKGHIVNSWNYPVCGVIADLAMESLVTNLLNCFPSVDLVRVVFLCGGSRNRGPNTALQFNRYCSLHGLKNKMEGYVLVGGYKGWKDRFQLEDPSMISGGK